MSFEIRVQPGGESFLCNAEETLLDAALRQGLTLPHGCKNGGCGTCKGKVLSGSYHQDSKATALNQEEKDTGLVLYCCTQPESVMEIECRQITRQDEIPARIFPARIEQMTRRSSDVLEILLRLPAKEIFRFRPGQFIDVLLKDGQRRSYSVANAPREDGMIELHIRHVPDGLFTTPLFTTMKEKDVLRFSGPHGGFFLRQGKDCPIILLASGTGFAPIKAIVEDTLSKGIVNRPMYLYWGGRKAEDLYLHELPRHWAATHAHIRYIPVLSDATPADAWSGCTGLVHEAVMAHHPDLSGFEVYACGLPEMVEAARRDFTTRCALLADAFYADAFTSSAERSLG